MVLSMPRARTTPPAEPVAELRRQREPVLVVDRVLVVAVEHGWGRGFPSHGAPHYSTFPHIATPLAPHHLRQRHHLCVDAWPRERARAAACGELERVEALETGPERECEARREAVSGAVRVDRLRGSGAALNGPPGCAQPPSAPDVVTTSRGSGSRSPGWYSSASSLPLPTSASSSTEPLPKRRELTRGRDEDASTPRQQQRIDVTRAEVDRVAARELVPGK